MITQFKDYQIKEIDLSLDGLNEISSLFKIIYSNESSLDTEYLSWQYNKNPNGSAIGYNAYHNNTLVAHYVVIPIKAKIFGEIKKGFLSLNTGTDPKHNGKGLFTHLATKTYELAKKKEGYFIAGVANKNSVYAFTKKLGFFDIGKLSTKIILYGTPILKEEGFEYEPYWDNESITWRLSNIKKNYEIIQKNNKQFIYAPTEKKLFKTLIGIFENQKISIKNINNLNNRFIKTFVGMPESLSWKNTISFDVPEKFRFTSLNLIYKPLEDSKKIPKSFKYLSIDFDGY